MKIPRIVLVTDGGFSDEVILDCVHRVAAALPPGAFGVQLRDKRRPLVSLRVFASQLRRATASAGAALWINGNAELARDVGADGVHLGAGAGTVLHARAVLARPCWVSVAAHSDQDVRNALDEGADAVLVCPVFASRSASASPRDRKIGRGVAAIRSAVQLARTRSCVYALGGVTADTARACVAAGAGGVAIIRALLSSAEPGRVARAIHDAFERR